MLRKFHSSSTSDLYFLHKLKKTFLQVRRQSSRISKLKQESKQTTVLKMLRKFHSSSTSDIFSAQVDSTHTAYGEL